MPDALSADERSALEYIRDNGAASESRRAQIILLSDEELAVGDIAAAVGLSKSTVWHWRRKWSREHLSIFGPSDDGARDDPPDDKFEGAEPLTVVDEPEAEPIPGLDEPRLPLTMANRVGLRPDDPMAEAGRKILRYHFERMLFNEPGSRRGEDIEAVHDMRVATRRMRSAFRLFRPFFTSKTVEPFRGELRSIAGALGAVRDLDVAIEKAEHFVADHPEADLTPLIGVWQAQLVQARGALIDELDSKQFARFVKKFDAFLREPGAGAKRLAAADDPATTYQVRHVAGRLIYEHYEQVRAYETVLEGAPVGTLHALRIDFKRLRYTLEFFEEVLGPEVKRVIKEIKEMQDHLGDLQDASVVSAEMRSFIDHHQVVYSGLPTFARPDISGVYQYAAAKQAEERRLIETFPEAWARFTAEDVRRDLALAVSVL